MHDAAWRCSRRGIIGGRVAAIDALHHQHRVGQIGSFLELEVEVGGGQYRCQTLHALQRLDAALGLPCLGRLGLEAVDELLQVGNFFLLLHIGVLRQLKLLGAGFLEGAVIATIARQLAVFDVQRDGGDGVEKFAVMADDDQRAVVALQPAFQPDQRVQVEVVGRLIKQQQVGGTHQRARQLQTHAPAAGKTVYRPGEFGRLETEAENQRLRPRFGVNRPGVVQSHVGVGQTLAVVGTFGGMNFLLRGQQRRIAFDDEGRGALAGFRQFLRDLRQPPGRRHEEFAAVFVQATGDQGKQRGLSGAVTPDEADSFAGIERDRGVVQQHLGAAAQAEVLEGNHGREGVRCGS